MIYGILITTLALAVAVMAMGFGLIRLKNALSSTVDILEVSTEEVDELRASCSSFQYRITTLENGVGNDNALWRYELRSLEDRIKADRLHTAEVQLHLKVIDIISKSIGSLSEKSSADDLQVMTHCLSRTTRRLLTLLEEPNNLTHLKDNYESDK